MWKVKGEYTFATHAKEGVDRNKMLEINGFILNAKISYDYD